MTIQNSEIRDELLRQVIERGPGKSICPSEVARAMAPEWQGLMRRVRAVAAALSHEQQIEILRKGKPVPPEGIKGVIRLRIKPAGELKAKATASQQTDPKAEP